MGVLRRPEPIPPRFVSFAWRYRDCARYFAPTGCRRPLPVDLDFIGDPEPNPGFDRGDLRVLPGSWVDPTVYMPWAHTPRGTLDTRPFSAEDIAFRWCHDVGSPISISRG